MVTFASFFPPKNSLCTIFTGFYCDHTAKICHRKDTGWGCHQSCVYRKQNKTMNCFLSNPWWAKVPLSCQLEFGAAFAKVFSVWGKARSMEAYVQCWVGTCFAKYAGSNSDLQERNWNRVWFSKLKLELNQIFSQRTEHLCVELELESRYKFLKKKWFQSRVNWRLINRNHQFTVNWIEIGCDFLNWNQHQIPNSIYAGTKIETVLIYFLNYELEWEMLHKNKEPLKVSYVAWGHWIDVGLSSHNQNQRNGFLLLHNEFLHFCQINK
jgi:hypothetical protein